MTTNVKKIKIKSPQAIAFIKRRMAEKALIRKAIRTGKPLKTLEKDGIRFATPL